MSNCPICQTEYEEQTDTCKTCGFDLSPYPISLNGIPEVYLERERGKLRWGRELWSQLQTKSNLSQAEYDKLLQAQTDLQQRYEWINGENVHFKQRIAQLETELRQAEGEKEAQKAQISELLQGQKQLNELLITELQGSRKIGELQQEVTTKQNQIEQLQRQNQQLSINLQTAQAEIKRLNELLKPPEPPDPLQTFRFETAQITSYDSNRVSIQRSQREAKQYVHDLGNGIKLEMVEIPAGRFMMGAVPNEGDAGSAEYPQHCVNVPKFYMSKYQITQAQYQQVMGTNPSHFKGNLLLPVENVNWENAKAFCGKLGKGYRLPSEAEWEYACRAGTTTPFYFGNTIAPSMVNHDGNYPYANAPKGEYRQKTTPVGSFYANAFGLFDMHGNVWEWCEDDWHEDYNGAPSDGSAWKTGGNAQYHVLRGGSWYSYAHYCRSANRIRYSNRYNSFGFRVASSIFARGLS